MKKATIGDLIEIPTRRGLAYAQYTHEHKAAPVYGELIRVFDGLFETRPRDLRALVDMPVRFSIFFPVKAAIRQRIFADVGNFPISEHNREFPIFRAGNQDPKSKKVSTWWFWDGQKEWRNDALTNEQRQMPLREIWNDTLLVQRIEDGWRPSTDPR